MRNIQARRHRRLVGPTSGKPTRAANDHTALLRLEPDEADIRAWEDEGGAVHALERHGLLRRTVTAAGEFLIRRA